MERRVPGATRAGKPTSGPARAKELLERWAQRLADAVDGAIDEPDAIAFRGPTSHALTLSGPGETHGRMEYHRAGVAFDLSVSAEASVGLVGVRCPLLIGNGSEDGVGLAALDLVLERGGERLTGSYRYGLHPFSGRVRIDPQSFRNAFKQLVRSAGYFIE
jgi:hypothetical protein